MIINYTTTNDTSNKDPGKRMREVKISHLNSVLKKSWLSIENETAETTQSESMNTIKESTEINSMPTVSFINYTETSTEENFSTTGETHDTGAEKAQRLRANVNSENFYPGMDDDVRPTLRTVIKSPSVQRTTESLPVTLNILRNQQKGLDIPDKITAVNVHPTVTTKQYNGTSTASHSEQNSTNSKLRTAGLGIVQVRMQNTTVLENGTTKLIYSVHLGGKPVPAETAAKDMALLSSQEVALELGVPVLIQSERKYALFYIYYGHK